MRIYNTYTKKKEEITKKNISLYTCGPTVYDFAHIGNFRTYVFEDLLKRSLWFLGFKVLHVMNITDIDDKTIKGALEKGISLEKYVEPYIKAFFEDIKTLKIAFADHYPKATEYIGPMIKIIKNLLDKKIAYQKEDGNIYFSIKTFPKYGKLSHLKLEDLQEGASQRIDLDEYDKENAADFVLWKAYDVKRDGNIFWDSPFGKGRPGWHIECSAMALELLKKVDIHCGGVDNIFPHHENEIAQSESYNGKKFVSYWMHSEHLLVDGKKMSKSLGNFYTLRDLLKKGYTGPQVRFLLLQVHYRSQMNFTIDGLNAAKHSIERIQDCIRRLENRENGKSFKDLGFIIERTRKSFKESLEDDLNISKALGYFFDFIKEINILCDEEKISKKDAGEILFFIKELDSVLQILPKEEDIPEDIQKMVLQREEARKGRDWKRSDEIRDQIYLKGYVIEDTKKGSIVKKR